MMGTRTVPRTILVLLLGIVWAIAACSVAPGATDVASTSVDDPTPLQTDDPAASDPTLPPPPSAPYTPAEFWAAVAPFGLTIENYDALGPMATSSDLVVVGRVAAIREGPPLGSDSPPSLMNGVVDVRIESVLAHADDSVLEPTVPVVFFVPDRVAWPRFTGAIPAERVVLFLRRVDRYAEWLGEKPDPTLVGLYAIVSAEGVLRDADGIVAAPLFAEAPFLAELEGTPFSDVVAEITTLAK